MLPAGFTARAPRMDDIEAVVQVENERTRHDIGESDTTVERMRMFWEAPDFTLATDCIVVLDADERIVAYADIAEYEPFTTAESDFAVLPEVESRGIEEFLFDWAYQRALSARTKAPDGARVTLEMHAWSTNRALQERFMQAGFQQSRVWHRMLIEMNEPPADPVWPAGISVRTFVPDEVDAVHAAWEDAQSDEWGHSSLTDEEFRYYFVERETDFDPTLWFLAIDDASGEIVGYTICRWERPGEPEVGHIRYVAVRRQYRRRGIARALLLHTFGEFYRRGKPKVGLLVDSTSLTGADRLYVKVGMQAVQTSIVFEREVG